MENVEEGKRDKITQYEKFVEERLKVDLQDLIDGRNKVTEQIQIYTDLAKSIRMLESNDVASMRTMVNLGSEVFMQADVPDTGTLYVDIGLGFHAGFTRLEALDFTAVKVDHLRGQLEKYTQQIASVKAQIKLVHTLSPKI